MASLHKRSLSNFVYPHPRSMDEQPLWLTIAQQRIKEEDHIESKTEVSIFMVPRTLMTISPHSYTPQHVALGPNHYWRPELHDMERYKIAAARTFQHQLQSRNLNFESLVEEFTNKHEASIRACYQRFIYFENKDLVWVMAIDAAFLLEFLQVVLSWQEQKSRMEPQVTSNKAMSGLAFTSVEIDSPETTSTEVPTEAQTPSGLTQVDASDLYRWSTSSRNTIVRDMVMLENQIPLFLLREMLKCRFPSEESANKRLYAMLKAFHKKFCPFKSIKDLEKASFSHAHLLDYIYRTILPEDVQTSADGSDIKDQSEKNNSVHVQNASSITSLLSEIKALLPGMKNKKLSKGVTKAIDIAMVVVSKLKGKGLSAGADGDSKKPPEIAIPSATELAKAGVRFIPIKDGDKFTSIRFDSKKAIFYLPTVKLDDNTEVILRNLVAYEASRHSSLYFTRYTELMNGIIDTAEDVRLLKERKIIQNHLKTDEEAANMWNGMSRSIKKKRVSDLDEVIKNVNKYYNSRGTIKVQCFMRHYVYESWQFLTFMAAILLLLIQLFEAFCSVQNCNTIFHFK